jgi:hypothetical protein
MPQSHVHVLHADVHRKDILSRYMSTVSVNGRRAFKVSSPRYRLSDVFGVFSISDVRVSCTSTSRLVRRHSSEPPDPDRPHPRTFTRTWTHHAEGDTEGIGGLHTTRTGVRYSPGDPRRPRPGDVMGDVVTIPHRRNVSMNGSSSIAQRTPSTHWHCAATVQQSFLRLSDSGRRLTPFLTNTKTLRRTAYRGFRVGRGKPTIK